MYGLSELVEKRGIKKGEIQAAFRLLLKKMNSKNMSLYEAMIDLGIEEDDYQTYINMFNELQID